MDNQKQVLTWGMLSKYRSQLYGFTIIWIVLFHIWETFSKQINYNWVLVNMIKRGNMGVDLFLILSGVSLYFSMKNKPGQSLQDFYKRRFSRLIKIYLFVCIPFFLMMLVTGNYSLDLFLRQTFFLNENVSSFWFLLIIAICYLIYPVVYRIIEANKKNLIYLIILIYTLGLMGFLYINRDAYNYYEILLSRIPIFLFGATLGDLVYKNKKIPSWVLVVSLLILVSLGPINLTISKITYFRVFSKILTRYMLGVQAFAVIVFFVLIIQYLTDTRIFKNLGKLGSITLEIYVVHIILRIVAMSVFRLPITTRPQILLFSLIYVPLSIILGQLLHKLLSYKKGDQ
ncbi:acyltransferase family protein [Erysipelothrix rhusiopathiae]|uniref:acyltransferase family protein n=1 Tax=Erysipelothrix rhusiopathiae TaxID=1648 RepID=UPI003F474566